MRQRTVTGVVPFLTSRVAATLESAPRTSLTWRQCRFVRVDVQYFLSWVALRSTSATPDLISDHARLQLVSSASAFSTT